MRVLTQKQFMIENTVNAHRDRFRPKQKPAWSVDWLGRDEEWNAHLAAYDNTPTDQLLALVELTDREAEPEEFLKVWPEAPQLQCCGEVVDEVVIINEEMIEDFYDVSVKFCSNCIKPIAESLGWTLV